MWGERQARMRRESHVFPLFDFEILGECCRSYSHRIHQNNRMLMYNGSRCQQTLRLINYCQWNAIFHHLD